MFKEVEEVEDFANNRLNSKGLRGKVGGTGERLVSGSNSGMHNTV